MGTVKRRLRRKQHTRGTSVSTNLKRLNTCWIFWKASKMLAVTEQTNQKLVKIPSKPFSKLASVVDVVERSADTRCEELGSLLSCKGP